MFGDPVTNPKGWPITLVGNAFSGFVGGKNLKCPDDGSSPYRFLKVSAVTRKVFVASESKVAPENFSPDAEHIVKAEDLLFSRANTANLIAATVYVWDTPANIVLPDKIWRMVIRDETKLHPLFAWELFKNPAFRYELSKRSSGTSGSMKNISKAKLVEVAMPNPPFDLQAKFAQLSRKLHAHYQHIEAQRQKIDQLHASINATVFAA